VLDNICILDFETTGLCPVADRVTEVGAIRFRDGKEVARFQCLVYQDADQFPLSAEVQRITGITPEMVRAGFNEGWVFRRLKEFIGSSVLVAHHAAFDMGFLASGLERNGASEPLRNDWLCTKVLAEVAVPGIAASLDGLCAWQSRARTQAHRALGDCTDTWAILSPLLDRFNEKGQTVLPINAVSTTRTLTAEQYQALPRKAWAMKKGARVVEEAAQ